MKRFSPCLIVLEATGGYESMVVASLQSKGFPLAVVNPRQIRDFAKSVGTLAKTDILDAKVIARFAVKIQPAPRILHTEAAKKLGDILVRRRQIVTMRTAEKNCLQQAPPSVMKRVKAHVTWLE